MIDDIKSLIPQREPIIMLDKVVAYSENFIETLFYIKNDSVFIEDDCFQPSGIIENIAQSAAAKLGVEQKKCKQKISLGYVAAIKNLDIFFLPQIKNTLRTTINITHRMNNIIVLRGNSFLENDAIAKCELKVFIQS